MPVRRRPTLAVIGCHHIVSSVLMVLLRRPTLRMSMVLLLPFLRMGTVMLLLLLPGAMGTVSEPSAFVHDRVFRVTVTSYSGPCLWG